MKEGNAVVHPTTRTVDDTCYGRRNARNVDDTCYGRRNARNTLISTLSRNVIMMAEGSLVYKRGVRKVEKKTRPRNILRR